MNFPIRSLTIPTLLAILASGVALSQIQPRLTGSVADNTTAVIVGAEVVVRNLASGVTYKTASNEAGVYVFPFLPAGQYELTCVLRGFKQFTQGGLVLETGLSRTLDITLEVGDVTETIRVKAATPLLESENSTVGQFIERSSVSNMPVESRRSGDLVRLTGGIVFTSSAENVPVFSMAGGRSQSQMWLLDGSVAQNNAVGVGQLVINPPVEALQEFTVQSSNYSAEFGRAGNGLILMTTRSGTNEFHGAVYEFLRNDKLDARTFFAQKKAPLRFNVFGTSFGGPVIKNKSFFFANYEGARRRTGLTVSDTIVPHPAELNGDFSARRDLTLLDPVSRAPFPNNIIPANRLDPLGRSFANFYPAPNIPNNDITRAPRANYIANTVNVEPTDFFTTRMDHSLSAKDRIYARVMYVRQPVINESIYPQKFADLRGFQRDDQQTHLVGSWIRNLTPAVFNEVRYSYQWKDTILNAFGSGSGKNGELGVHGVNPDFFPRIDVTGISSLGFTLQQRLSTPLVTHQAIDTATWIRGKHSMKAGLEFRYSSFTDVYNNLAGGNFSFGNRATGSGLAELLLGLPTSGAVNQVDALTTRTDYYGAFLQDDWKVTPKLTLNVGLRWEMDSPRWVKDNRQNGFDPSVVNPVAGVPGVVTFAGLFGYSKYAHDFDKNNLGPRFGLAYRLGKGLVVRTGYGISYNGAYARAAPFRQFSGFGLSGSFTSPDGGFTPAFLFRDGMPNVAREPLTLGFGAVKVGQSPRLSPEFLQQNHVNGYVQQWNFTVQKELAGSMLLELAYLGNAGHKLGGPSLDINMSPLVNGRGPDRQSQLLRPFPQFNSVLLGFPPWGNSAYHAMNLKLEKRYSHGLNLLMNYTWSKFLDDVESVGELGGEAGIGYTHIERRRLDRSFSGNDIRHRYIASVVYELPFGLGRHWRISNPALNHIAGGWGMGVITEFRQGAPYGVIEQTNTSNTFSSSQRPNLVRDPALSADRPRSEFLARYFDPSAFQAPGTGVFGDAPRNLCCGPGFIGIDLSVHKPWRLTERYGLTFRTDFYNLPNRPQFANPALLRGQATFGTINSILAGSTGRMLQLSLRLEF